MIVVMSAAVRLSRSGGVCAEKQEEVGEEEVRADVFGKSQSASKWNRSASYDASKQTAQYLPANASGTIEIHTYGQVRPIIKLCRELKGFRSTAHRCMLAASSVFPCT